MTARADVVIAVHSPTRPIERAVASVLASGDPGDVRALVVVHNTDRAPIAARLGALADNPAVQLLELQDGIRSPAGPFNAGLDAATAPYTSVLGSDDEFAPGAVASWLEVAQRTRADAVIARLRVVGARPVPTPPTRPFRRRELDPVRDRLSYRSAPLGLVSRERFGTLRFGTGLAVGEDISYVTRLWFSGAHIAYDRRGPAYLLHDEGADRSTVAPRPVADELAYVPRVIDDPWFQQLPATARGAIAVKFLRIHLFGAITNRDDPAMWTPGERADLSATASRILDAGGGIERVLSRRDRALLDLVLDAEAPTQSLLAAARLRRRHAHPDSLLPRRLRDALHREAPLRMASASALQLL
jgi:hypothetical protein